MTKERLMQHYQSWESFYAKYFDQHKRQANGEWKVKCPFHEDKTPSMSINMQTGMFNCFGCGKKGSAFDFFMAKHGVSFPEAVAQMCRSAGITDIPHSSQTQKAKEVKKYDYHDAAGNVVTQTIRYDPKNFKQRARVDGKFVWSLKGVKTVLYRLPEVLRADQVLVVEGEKDCDTAKDLGIVATTCPMGAGKWRPEYTETLAGKNIVLVADCDGPGIKHMAEVGKALNPVSRVRWLEFPGQNPKGFDLSDFVAGFDNEFEAMKQVDALIRSARLFDEKNIIIPEPDTPESDRIKSWIQASPGEFSVRDLDYDLGFTGVNEKESRTKILEKFVAEKIISREGKRRGVYRPYQSDLKSLDYLSPDDSFLEIWLPLGIHKKVGIMPGNIIVLAGEANAGKALKNDTQVLTSEGWVDISDITTNHIIFGKNGKKEKVLGVYPQQGERDCYRFNFSDGSWVDSDGEHIWTLQTDYQMTKKLTGNGNKNKTYKQWINLTTNQIVSKYGVGKQIRRRPKLPINESVEFDSVPVPIDPYILGALLGDGGIANATIKIHSEDVQVLKRFTGLGYILTHDNGVSYRVTVKPEHVKVVGSKRSTGIKIAEHTTYNNIPQEKFRLKTHLAELGLFGKHSHDKFIPKKYLFNSIEIRTEVLKGLMDTDGYIDESGRTIEFCSVSKQLAEDVQFLARSLGARAVLRRSSSFYKKNRTTIKCLDKFRVFITTDKPVFYLSRKLKRQRPFLKTNEKKIVSIEKIGKHETTCIMTSAKDGLFIAKDFTVTHNTALMLNIIKSNMNKFDVHYFNSEMGPGELKSRLTKFEGLTLEDWNFNAYERDRDFADVIFSGENSLNIIDFLEVHDEFYLVGEKIKQIHSALNGGVAIIAIQKNKGAEFGVGGNRTMEKARLVVNVEPGKCKITKAKNFINPGVNPNGWCCDWKLVNGCQFVLERSGWYYEQKKGKENF